MRASLKTVGIYAAIIAVTLFAAEMLARIYVWTPFCQAPTVGDRLGDRRYDQSYGGFGDLLPNQDGHWVVWFHRPYHVQTNSVGLRNVEEPSPSAFRILALGDSQTFGPYLANEDTWPAWAENALRTRLGSPGGLQVLNAGIAGYTIADELAYLKEKGVAFRPDLVVLAVFENDLTDLKLEGKEQFRRKPPPKKKFAPGLSKELRARFALFQVVEDIKRSINFAKNRIDIRKGEANPVGPAAGTEAGGGASQPADELAPLKQRYDRLFDETAALLKSNHIPFAVVFIPAGGDGPEERPSNMAPLIREAARRGGVPLFEATQALRSVPDAAARFYLLQRDPKSGNMTGNGHLSREGNAVIGTAVADWLLSQSLVRNGVLPGAAQAP